MAEWLLANQDAGGALQDYRGGDICNVDSNMEYALIGLGAAYARSGDPRFLAGLESGIRWLAAREDMSATAWRGSWFYAYSCSPPYAPVPTSPGGSVMDVRGVDTTSALFVYLLYVHRELSKSSRLATELADHAKAALEFLMTQSMDADGFTWSSWQLVSGKWQLWRYKYTADQADVYLGLRGGSVLYDGADRRYGQAADAIQHGLPATFFDPAQGRYATGMDDSRALDHEPGFDGTFAQGYVPWVIGSGSQNLASYAWLLRGAQPSGKLVLFSGDPGYSLSVDTLALAAVALGDERPEASLQWLLTTTYDAATGAVRDTGATGSDETSNVVGFSILALLGQAPFAW
jgi:hypothetical protein